MNTNMNINANAYRIASKIFERANIIVNNDDKAKLHAELENAIKTLNEIEEINVDDNIEYYDFEPVLNTVKARNSNAALVEIVEIAVTEQVESWLAQLAQLVDTQINERVHKLESLYSIGSKVNKIKNHSDFHFLGGYIGKLSEQMEGQQWGQQ